MTFAVLSTLIALRYVVLLAIALGAMSFSVLDSRETSTTTTSAPAPATVEHSPGHAARFEPVEVIIDPHGHPLATYQIEIKTGSAQATLAGVEGGDHAAYAEPPYYDSHALSTGRIIVAAFNTGSDLPKDPIRVATLMVHVDDGAHPNYTATLVIAADRDAHPIEATVVARPLIPRIPDNSPHTSPDTGPSTSPQPEGNHP